VDYYPVFLDLRGRPCLVVGGGEIATRKVIGLLSTGVDITVISPAVSRASERHAREKKLRHLSRRYQEGDLRGYFLAYAASGVLEVDVLMSLEKRMEQVLLNVVDRPVLCDFFTPVVLRRDRLSVAVSTGGEGRGFAKRMQQKSRP
jgi:precorrin-2 dehydrogenase/sirohydrochlorin ferrochelatase